MARSTARLLEHSPLSLGPMARHGSSSEVFSEHFLERRDIEHLLRQHLLQLRILGLQRLQPPGVGHFHAAILRPPLVEGRIANPVLAAQILCAQPSLVLLQNANDLFFAETASLHRLSPSVENRLTSNRGLFRGAGHRWLPRHTTQK